MGHEYGKGGIRVQWKETTDTKVVLKHAVAFSLVLKKFYFFIFNEISECKKV